MTKLHIKLDQILKDKGMTQAELARLTGMRPAAVSELVNNQRTTVNKEHLIRIADTLKIENIEDLMVFVRDD